MIRLAADQVVAAREGDRAALDAIVRSAERPVFNVAMRMLGNRADAEDATQEILVKIITHLGSIRDVESAGAWAFRIACRHLVHERKRGAIEAMQLSLEAFAADLETGLSPLSDHGLNDVEARLAVEEVKVGCTLAMLVCLSRDLRIAYILGEIFEVSAIEAADILDIDPAAYRQRLRRARTAVTAFVMKSCGLVTKTASCRCQLRVGQALSIGRIAKGGRDLTANLPNVAEVRRSVIMLEQGRTSAALMRSNPDFVSEVGQLVMQMVDAKDRRL
ncbi:MAG: RNA polymerase sigma factor [Erythrobacter sp.]|jgi:RNA polymerase sigma factor (sigma-70 family)